MKFKIGDKLLCIRSCWADLPTGGIYEVKKIHDKYCVEVIDSTGDLYPYHQSCFKLYKREQIEEPKPKVKYYPVLLRDDNNGNYEITKDIKLKDNSDLNYYSFMKRDYNIVAVRLITEIPELIEEREA